jgi:hypothetical protein
VRGNPAEPCPWQCRREALVSRVREDDVMRRFPVHYSLLVMFIMMMGAVVGCAPGASLEAPIAAVTATAAPSSTATSLPTLTPSPTVTSIPRTDTPHPTRDPTVPTPILPASVSEDFFFGGNTPDCQLPCWNGLIVGESDCEDVQAVFVEVFGFDEVYDPFAELPPSYTIPGHPEHQPNLPPGFAVGGHRWGSENPTYGLDIMPWVEEETCTLMGLEFRWGRGGSFDPPTQPQHIIQELGMPSQMLILVQMTELADYLSVRLFTVYENGVVFFQAGHASIITTTTAEGDADRVAEFCLDDRGGFGGGEARIVAPLLSDDWDPIQETFVGGALNDPHFVPIQEAFGINLEELTRIAIEEDNPCIYADW